MSEEPANPMSARSLVMCGLLVLATFSGVQAFPEEDSNFQSPHTGPDFPVGWIDFSVNQQGAPGQDHRLVYPAMVSGEDNVFSVYSSSCGKPSKLKSWQPKATVDLHPIQ